jgi:hypothetical protein
MNSNECSLEHAFFRKEPWWEKFAIVFAYSAVSAISGVGTVAFSLARLPGSKFRCRSEYFQ